jgi:hypothetical protein
MSDTNCNDFRGGFGYHRTLDMLDPRDYSIQTQPPLR